LMEWESCSKHNPTFYTQSLWYRWWICERCNEKDWFRIKIIATEIEKRLTWFEVLKVTPKINAFWGDEVILKSSIFTNYNIDQHCDTNQINLHCKTVPYLLVLFNCWVTYSTVNPILTNLNFPLRNKLIFVKKWDPIFIRSI
jgi:hypothetical protein